MTWMNDTRGWLSQVAVRIKRRGLPGDYRAVFGSPEGERVLADLTRQAGILRDSTGLPSEILHETAGAQHILHHIYRKLRLKPAQLQHLAHIEGVDDE